MEQSFEAMVIEELKELRRQHLQVLNGVAEVKGELVALQGTTGQTLTEARRTNGRVSKLEQWQQAVALQDAGDRGRIEGAATAALTKGQLRAVLTLVTAISALSGTVVGIVVRIA